MNQCVSKIWFPVLLYCVRGFGQNAEPGCSSLPPPSEPQAQAGTELHVWLDSIDRRPCAGQPGAMLSGSVSARSLAHKPLPKARQEFDRGMRARRKRVDAEAVAHFEAAARLDPDFVDAHAWAGLVHVEARQPSLALPYYQQAVRLEPANAALLSNLASVLIVVNRPAEAEPAARRAVQLAPSSVEAHFMLGLALFARGQATEETVAHLTIAADKYPRAREMLATIQLILASQAASTR